MSAGRFLPKFLGMEELLRRYAEAQSAFPAGSGGDTKQIEFRRRKLGIDYKPADAQGARPVAPNRKTSSAKFGRKLREHPGGEREACGGDEDKAALVKAKRRRARE